MKKLFILLVFPISVFAQQHDFAYGKISGLTLFEKDKDVRLGAYGAMGARINRYLTAGFAAGYFKLQDAKKAIIPVGLDINVTDFGRRGFYPIVTGGIYYPFYKERIDSPLAIYDASGKFMYKVGGGFCFGVTEKEKIAFTLEYSQIALKANRQVSTGSIFSPDPINLLIASISFIL